MIGNLQVTVMNLMNSGRAIKLSDISPYHRPIELAREYAAAIKALETGTANVVGGSFKDHVTAVLNSANS